MITPLIERLATRGLKYTIVGLGTFTLDLCIIWLLLLTTDIRITNAVTVGFLVGASINYFLSYYWVFRGTKQTLAQGYVIFIVLAVLTATAIGFGTATIHTVFETSLFIARTITGGCVGVINFLINAFFNFKKV